MPLWDYVTQPMAPVRLEDQTVDERAIKSGNPMSSFSCQPVSQNGVREMHRQALSEIDPCPIWTSSG